MIYGKYFTIPESPSDVEQLRARSTPLNGSTCPAWLEQDDRDYYRYLGHRSSAGVRADELDAFREEIQQLEFAGLVVDRDQANPDVHRLYIRSTSDYDIWSIGIYTGRSLFDLQPAAGVTNPVLTRDDVTDVAAVLVADPFMIRQGHQWFMFFELLNWHANKGEIGVATSDDGSTWSYRQRVLSEPFHLSYPYIFECDGEFFMIPETKQCAAVRLYRASEFPAKWTLVKLLQEGEAMVDASVFQHEDRWWMFVYTEQDDALRLYMANTLTGDWREHPSSPIVKGDRRSARPAGRVVAIKEKAFRFAQNCHGAYGLDVRVFEIDELSEKTYCDTELAENPILSAGGTGWNANGMHHVDAHQLEDGTWIACVDGWRRA